MSRLFNSKLMIEINKKLLVFKKLKEQQEQNRINEAIQEAQRQKINEWWEKTKAEIKPWTKERRAFYEKHTFNFENK